MSVRTNSDADGGGAIASGGALALTLMAIVVLPMPGAFAAEKWQPTVSSTSQSMGNGAVPAAPLPTWNDPRYRSPPLVRKDQQPPVNPLPQGAWSPIVTGALSSDVQAEASPDERVRFVQNAAPAAAAVAAAAQRSSPAASPASKAAQTAVAGSSTSTIVPRQGPLEALPPDATPAQQYCFNTADSAADARFAWQANKIKEMEAELEKRAAQLEAKTEEYKRWLARRDEFSKKAQEKLVAFYAKMRPDAAALHMTAMDDESAAALLTKLEPKVASLVMAEITPDKAAKIAAVISGAAKIPPNRRPRPAPQPAAQQGAPQSPQSGGATTPDNRPRS